MPTAWDLSNDTTISALAFIIRKLKVGRKSAPYNTHSATFQEGEGVGALGKEERVKVKIKK